MRHYLMLLIFILFSNFFSAHKPKVKVENFGNVKTYYVSEFNFSDAVSSEELKIQILGKLSEDIAKRLGYKDTLLIEYKVRFNERMDKLAILESENSHYKIPGLVEGNILKSNGSGLAVRIIDTKINVDEILKLVEYTIINRKQINKYLNNVKFSYDEENSIDVWANSEEFINTITRRKSKLVEEVMDKAIVLLANRYLQTELFWKNNEFVFGINTVPSSDRNYMSFVREQYKVKDFKYFVDSPLSGFFVISDEKDRLIHFDGIEENTGMILEIGEKDRTYPFNISKDRFKGKVILFNNGYYFYVYDINKKTTLKIE
ncbi:hypothetical protein [Chryseobacterium sp. OSA05B]|uniref:hypothetical protein n=1 Tax=Chryseobacterium sp. OSA05B TaxID=2862650 RepID=UPI001CBEC230|nr:hypothetical protein [Chryseobacterium sp. OSA05B]